MLEHNSTSSFWFVRSLEGESAKNYPKYQHIFVFEDNFDFEVTKVWMDQNWTLSIYLAAVYIMAVFGLRHWMTNRPPLNIRGIMVIWNASLSIFSLLAFIRCFPEFLNSLEIGGFYYSVCKIRNSVSDHKIASFWYWIVVLSKAFELMDTIFIVARKRKLIFLHYFHHSITLVFSWFMYTQEAPIGRWFTVMNMAIHTVMYGYFSLMSMRFKLPKKVAMAITSAQIVQMFVGAYASFYVYALTLKEVPCSISPAGARSSVLLYLIHFYLFIKLFRDSYLSKTQPSKHEFKRD